MSTSEEMVNNVYQSIAKLDAKVKILDKDVRNSIDALPAWAYVDKKLAIWAWNKFVDKMNEAWDKLQLGMDSIVWPSDIREGKSVWTKHVGAPVSKISGQSAKSNTEVDRYWEGGGAGAYIDILPVQQEAMNSIKSYSDKISTALEELAGAETKFLLWFGGSIIVFIAAIVAAIATTETVIGAIAFATGGVAAFLAGFGEGYGDLHSAVSSQSTTLRTDVVSDSKAFPGGKWPKATIYG